MLTQTERVGKRFFKRIGLRAEKICESTEQKSPDFKVFKGDQLVFFSEVKSLEFSGRTRRLIDETLRQKGPSRTISEGFYEIIVTDATNPANRSRIADGIHRAIKQFKSVNSRGNYPNVILFLDLGGQLGAVDMAQFLGIDSLFPVSMRVPISPNPPSGDSIKRIAKEIYEIDLYIWAEGRFGSASNTFLFWNKQSRHRSNLRKLFPNRYRQAEFGESA
jgi:hypothetical protein